MATILSMVRAGFASSMTQMNSAASRIASASATGTTTTAQSKTSTPAVTGNPATRAVRASLIAAATGTGSATSSTSTQSSAKSDLTSALVDQAGALYNFRANAKVLSVLNTQASTISFLA